MLRRVFFGFNDAQTIADFGYLPLLHEDLLESTIERARDFDTCFVALDFTKRVKSTNGRLGGYIPVGEARASARNEKRGPRME